MDNYQIPNGWEEFKVRDIIEDFVRGISYSSNEILDPNGIPMMNLASIDKSGYYREGEMKYYSGKYSETDKIYSEQMLIACTDLTREADIIGTPIIVPKGYDYLVFTMDLAKLTPRKGVSPRYLYYALKTNAYRKYIKPWASGTNVLHLNLKGVYDYRIILPKGKVSQDKIASVLANYDNLISLNREINRNLAN